MRQIDIPRLSDPAQIVRVWFEDLGNQIPSGHPGRPGVCCTWFAWDCGEVFSLFEPAVGSGEAGSERLAADALTLREFDLDLSAWNGEVSEEMPTRDVRLG